MFVFRCLALAAALCTISGFSSQDAPPAGQPKDERAAQDSLPQSKDPMWKTLGKTKIHLDQKEWKFSATYPSEVKALVGKEITITGFILPLDSTEKFKHFIISKRTPTCPFCPPGEPNEIIDVMLKEPIKWDEDAVTVKGTFGLMNNPDLGMFFTLKNAQKVK